MKRIIIAVSLLFTVMAISSCKKSKCESVTCLNGGTCDENTGKCICGNGFSGDHCQNYDSCYGVVCLNGGTCINGHCSCPAGYMGPDCGTLVCQYTQTGDMSITNTESNPYALSVDNVRTGQILYPGITGVVVIHANGTHTVTATQNSGYILYPTIYNTPINLNACDEYPWSF